MGADVNSTHPAELPNEDIERIIGEVDTRIAAYSAEFLPILSPLLEGNNESAKTLISISGGALVATISIIQFFAEKIKDPQATWLLPASWVLFVVTIVFSLYLQGAVTQFRSLRLQLLNARIDGLESWKRSNSPNLVDLETELRGKMQRKVDSINAFHKRSMYAAGGSFLLALVALVLFAILNLPF